MHLHLQPMRPKSSLPPKKTTPPARASRPAVATRTRGQLSHEIRIIGGQWRRSVLKVLDKPGLRPTPDRVRETLFNWLGQDLTGWRCVDAFAGTGALGLEAASRGATQVVVLEQDPDLVKALLQQVERLKATGVQVQRGDAVAAMQRLSAAAFDLVFLDPPFAGALALETGAPPQGWGGACPFAATHCIISPP
jgi:16S rRNA (guanine966-N2)-methyltransferase